MLRWDVADLHIVTVQRDIAAPLANLFELIADPAHQPRWTATTTWPRRRRANGYAAPATCSR